MLSRFALLAATILLAPRLLLAGYDDRSEWSVWAPGIINPNAGTADMEVEFLVTRDQLQSDWIALFRVPGNRRFAGDSTLGLSVCPGADSRDLGLTARGTKGEGFMNIPCPEYPLNKPCRFTMTWDGSTFALWFNGRLLKREAYSGPLPLLPAKFIAGQEFSTGVPAGLHVRAIRISDRALPPDEIKKVAPLEPDSHTTFLGIQGKPDYIGKTDWQVQSFGAALFPDRVQTPFAVDQGQPFPLKLWGVNYGATPAKLTVRCEVENRAGQNVLTKEFPVELPASSGYQTYEVSLPAQEETGFFAMNVTVTDAADKALTYVVDFVVQPHEDLQPGKLSQYLGHHYPLFSDVGYEWVRAWGLQKVLHWYKVEPIKGQFDWTSSDRFVQETKKRGQKILAVLGYPPAWASTYSPAERDRLKLSPKPGKSNSPERYQPRSIEEWKDYVRAVVTRYKDDIKYWEIYNEVDFHPPAMHATFTGSTQDYLDLLRSAREVIKEVDPEAQVLTSGFSLSKGITDAQMPLDLLKLGGVNDFDIFNVHGYTDKETIAETTAAVRKAKPGVPLWMSEYMFEKPADDYLLVDKAFWFLDQGYSKYFLFGGELDRGFDSYGITPFYAVAAELSRQLRACDEYLGPVPGTAAGMKSWQLRRTDGSYLQAFAVDNGKVNLWFEKTAQPLDVQVTDLYGATIYKGPWGPERPLAYEGWAYVTSNEKLAIARAKREHGNVLANAGFEIREGDYLADESMARPASWTLRPSSAPTRSMSFAPGRTGEYALRLRTDPEQKVAGIAQMVFLDEPGEWVYSAWVKAEAGVKGYIRIQFNMDGKWIQQVFRRFTGTGEWQSLTTTLQVKRPDQQAVVLVGLDTPGSEALIDDLELIHARAK